MNSVDLSVIEGTATIAEREKDLRDNRIQSQRKIGKTGGRGESWR